MVKPITAYIIGHISIKDHEKWLEYRNRVPATLEPWGAELIARGKLVSIFAGDCTHTDSVVIRFPNIDSLTLWHSSPDYQALIPLRTEAADMILLSYEAEITKVSALGLGQNKDA